MIGPDEMANAFPAPCLLKFDFGSIRPISLTDLLNKKIIMDEQIRDLLNAVRCYLFAQPNSLATQNWPYGEDLWSPGPRVDNLLKASLYLARAYEIAADSTINLGGDVLGCNINLRMELETVTRERNDYRNAQALELQELSGLRDQVQTMKEQDAAAIDLFKKKDTETKKVKESNKILRDSNENLRNNVEEWEQRDLDSAKHIKEQDDQILKLREINESLGTLLESTRKDRDVRTEERNIFREDQNRARERFKVELDQQSQVESELRFKLALVETRHDGLAADAETLRKSYRTLEELNIKHRDENTAIKLGVSTLETQITALTQDLDREKKARKDLKALTFGATYGGSGLAKAIADAKYISNGDKIKGASLAAKVFDEIASCAIMDESSHLKTSLEMIADLKTRVQGTARQLNAYTQGFGNPCSELLLEVPNHDPLKCWVVQGKYTFAPEVDRSSIALLENTYDVGALIFYKNMKLVELRAVHHIVGKTRALTEYCGVKFEDIYKTLDALIQERIEREYDGTKIWAVRDKYKNLPNDHEWIQLLLKRGVNEHIAIDDMSFEELYAAMRILGHHHWNSSPHDTLDLGVNGRWEWFCKYVAGLCDLTKEIPLWAFRTPFSAANALRKAGHETYEVHQYKDIKDLAPVVNLLRDRPEAAGIMEMANPQLLVIDPWDHRCWVTTGGEVSIMVNGHKVATRKHTGISGTDNIRVFRHGHVILEVKDSPFNEGPGGRKVIKVDRKARTITWLHHSTVESTEKFHMIKAWTHGATSNWLNEVISNYDPPPVGTKFKIDGRILEFVQELDGRWGEFEDPDHAFNTVKHAYETLQRA